MIKGFLKSRILPLGSRIVKNKNFTLKRIYDFLIVLEGFHLKPFTVLYVVTSSLVKKNVPCTVQY